MKPASSTWVLKAGRQLTVTLCSIPFASKCGTEVPGALKKKTKNCFIFTWEHLVRPREALKLGAREGFRQKEAFTMLFLLSLPLEHLSPILQVI